MKPSGSRAKGRNFEVEMSKRIGDWWCKDKKSFYRNSGSGSRVHTTPTAYSGDIVPVSDVALPWPLHIEVKKNESWSFEGFVSGNASGALLQHMCQCLYDCFLTKRKGLLICSRNYSKIYVFLPVEHWRTYKGYHSVKKHASYSRFSRWSLPDVLVKGYDDFNIDFVCITWKAFITYFDRKGIMQWMEHSCSL